jgi:hypothetical protein
MAANMLNAIKVRFNELESVFTSKAHTQLNDAAYRISPPCVSRSAPRGNDDVRYERVLAQAQHDRAVAEYYTHMGKGIDLKGVRGTL